MTSWLIAKIQERCGNCSEPIVAGGRLLEIRVGTARKLRCATCGEALKASIDRQPGGEQ